VPNQPNWLSPSEDRAWRAFRHASRELSVRLDRQLLQDSGLTGADYQVLAALSEHSTDRMPAQELCAQLHWEKSRLSHQVHGMEKKGLLAREANPADARSAMIRLLPAGSSAIVDAAPRHVETVRRDFVDLFTPAELEAFAKLNERIRRHLAGEPPFEQGAPDNPGEPSI